jgi:hypothetical protein
MPAVDSGVTCSVGRRPKASKEGNRGEGARPVRLFIAENGIKCDEELVDILKGAHYQEPYASLNPNELVPMRMAISA